MPSVSPTSTPSPRTDASIGVTAQMTGSHLRVDPQKFDIESRKTYALVGDSQRFGLIYDREAPDAISIQVIQEYYHYVVDKIDKYQKRGWCP